MKKTLEAIN
jgi:hypothetical protein